MEDKVGHIISDTIQANWKFNDVASILLAVQGNNKTVVQIEFEQWIWKHNKPVQDSILN